MGAYRDGELPVIARGEGCYLEDANGKRYLDALAGLFAVQIGYCSATRSPRPRRPSSRELPSTQSGGTPTRRRSSSRRKSPRSRPSGFELGLLHLRGLRGGRVRVEVRTPVPHCARRATVEGDRPAHAYHGTTMGALSINGIPGLRRRSSRSSRALSTSGTRIAVPPIEGRPRSSSRVPARELEQRSDAESPETIAMVIMEPVQNQGGSFIPPAGYWAGVRELCDRYGILLCADEVITGFGRLATFSAPSSTTSSPT